MKKKIKPSYDSVIKKLDEVINRFNEVNARFNYLIELMEGNKYRLQRVTVTSKEDDTVILNLERDETGEYKGIARDDVDVEIV